MCEVSVCIPTFNGERFLQEAIESVLAQDFQDFELIIVDDASTDGTVDIVHNFKDSRLRFYRNEISIGIPGNWNVALNKIKGRYVKYLFQDDVLYPYCISTMLEACKGHEAVGLVFSRRDIRIEDGLPTEGLYVYMTDLQEPLRRRGKIKAFSRGRDLLEACIKYGGLFFNYFAEPSFVMFDSKWIPKVGYFDNRLRQNVDYGYWLRFLLVSDVSFIDKPLGAFRLHRGSESFGQNIPYAKLRYLWEERVVIERLRNFARQEGAAGIASLLDARQKWYFLYRFPFIIQQRLFRMCARGRSIWH